MTEDQIRELERQESTTRKTGELLGTSCNRVWLWRHGVAKLTKAELDTLRSFLAVKVAERVSTLKRITSL
jgi:hypothetical protein